MMPSITKPVIAATIAARVAALPVSDTHIPCKSRQASEILSPASHQPDPQQVFESPRLRSDPVQVIITVEIKSPEVEEDNRSLGGWPSRMVSYLVNSFVLTLV